MSTIKYQLLLSQTVSCYFLNCSLSLYCLNWFKWLQIDSQLEGLVFEYILNNCTSTGESENLKSSGLLLSWRTSSPLPPRSTFTAFSADFLQRLQCLTSRQIKKVFGWSILLWAIAYVVVMARHNTNTSELCHKSYQMLQMHWLLTVTLQHTLSDNFWCKHTASGSSSALSFFPFFDGLFS